MVLGFLSATATGMSNGLARPLHRAIHVRRSRLTVTLATSIRPVLKGLRSIVTSLSPFRKGYSREMTAWKCSLSLPRRSHSCSDEVDDDPNTSLRCHFWKTGDHTGR